MNDIPVQVTVDEREAFEMWIRSHMPEDKDWLRRRSIGGDTYRLDMIEMAWMAWKARAGKL